MYIYMYIYICKYIYIHTHTHTYIYIYIYIYKARQVFKEYAIPNDVMYMFRTQKDILRAPFDEIQSLMIVTLDKLHRLLHIHTVDAGDGKERDVRNIRNYSNERFTRNRNINRKSIDDYDFDTNDLRVNDKRLKKLARDKFFQYASLF